MESGIGESTLGFVEQQQRARQLLQEGFYRQGLDILMGLEAKAPPDAARLSSIGGALFHLGRLRGGERWLRRALALDPSHAGARLNLANTLYRLGRIKEAETLYLELTAEVNPQPLAVVNYGNFLFFLQRDEEAESWLRKACGADVQNLQSRIHLGLLLARTNRSKEALDVMRDVVGLEPGNGPANLILGEMLISANSIDKALDYLSRAVELMPENPLALAALGRAMAIVSEVEEAEDLFDRAAKCSPSSLLAQFNANLLTPVIPRSSEHMTAYGSRVSRGLAYLKAWFAEQSTSAPGSSADSLAIHGQWNPPVSPVTVQTHLFHLAYQDADVRPWFEPYGDLLRQVFDVPSGDSDFSCAVQLSRKRDGRLRIGFASQYLYFHSNSRAFEGLVRYLDRERFEVVIIHGPASTQDAIRQRIDATAQEVVQLVEDPGEALAQLQALDLQILFYTDLGMNMFMNALAMHRVAPIQVTGWGIPHTSGLRSMDYYISSALTEPEGAEQHYTEQLVRLPALPCCYLAENLELIEVPRDYFFLPPTGPIIGCLQSLYKLHPDFDLALEQIAIANPEALFVFVESPHASLTRAFQARLKERAPTLSEQMVFLAIMNHKHFVALSNCMDFLLDPFYYCSGITFYESSYTGTPTVTLEGQYMRGRYVAGAYRYLGLPNAPIAASVEEYVQIANHLIGNPEALAALRSDLRRLARAHLYDDLRTVRSFEAFCQQAWAQVCAGDGADLPAVELVASTSQRGLLQDSSEAAA